MSAWGIGGLYLHPLHLSLTKIWVTNVCLFRNLWKVISHENEASSCCLRKALSPAQDCETAGQGHWLRHDWWTYEKLESLAAFLKPTTTTIRPLVAWGRVDRHRNRQNDAGANKSWSIFSYVRFAFAFSAQAHSCADLNSLLVPVIFAPYSRLGMTPWTTLASRNFEPAPSSLFVLNYWYFRKGAFPCIRFLDSHGRTARAFCRMQNVVEPPTFDTRSLHGSLASSQVRSHLIRQRDSQPGISSVISDMCFTMWLVLGKPCWTPHLVFSTGLLESH